MVGDRLFFSASRKMHFCARRRCILNNEKHIVGTAAPTDSSHLSVLKDVKWRKLPAKFFFGGFSELTGNGDPGDFELREAHSLPNRLIMARRGVRYPEELRRSFRGFTPPRTMATLCRRTVSPASRLPSYPRQITPAKPQGRFAAGRGRSASSGNSAGIRAHPCTERPRHSANPWFSFPALRIRRLTAAATPDHPCTFAFIRGESSDPRPSAPSVVSVSDGDLDPPPHGGSYISDRRTGTPAATTERRALWSKS